MLEVLVDSLCFAQQEGNVLIRGVDEPPKHLHGLLELLGKLLLLLVAPRLAEFKQPAVQGGELVVKLGIEPLQVVSETAEFFWVDDCFCHCS